MTYIPQPAKMGVRFICLWVNCEGDSTTNETVINNVDVDVDVIGVSDDESTDDAALTNANPAILF